MLLHDFHQSGRFDATIPESQAMMHRADLRTTVGGCTEAKRLKAPEGWLKIGDESAVFFDASVWDLVDHGVESIKTPQWKRGKSVRHSVEITWALLRHRDSGQTLLRMVGHLPAHLFRPWQRKANLAALKGLGRLIRTLDRDLHPDHFGASFDFNRDLRWKRTRRLIADRMGETGLRLVVPPKGTHLLRKIDGYLSTCPIAQARMFPRFTGFDHRGFLVRTCFS